MSVLRRVAALVLGTLLLPRSARAQPWSSPALSPSVASLTALEHDVAARAHLEAAARRSHLRPFVSLGVAVHRAATRSDAGLTLERQPGAAPQLALGLRRGLGALLEGDLLREIAAPIAVTAFPAALAAAAAMQPCDGTRRFELPAGSALDVALAATLRARLVRPSSPFYVGLGVRLSAAVVDARGVATARCIGPVPEPPPPQAEVDRIAWTTRVDAAVETGFRFGDREAWDVGLRMLVTDLGRNDTRVGGAQWFVAWHFR